MQARGEGGGELGSQAEDEVGGCKKLGPRVQTGTEVPAIFREPSAGTGRTTRTVGGFLAS